VACPLLLFKQNCWFTRSAELTRILCKHSLEHSFLSSSHSTLITNESLIAPPDYSQVKPLWLQFRSSRCQGTWWESIYLNDFKTAIWTSEINWVQDSHVGFSHFRHILFYDVWYKSVQLHSFTSYSVCPSIKNKISINRSTKC